MKIKQEVYMLNKCLLIAVVLSLFSFDSSAQKKKGVSSASEIIKVGITAPDFEISKLETILKNPEPEKAVKVKLSEEYTSKPVLLLFGSYT